MLLEQVEGDARAQRAAGGEEPVQSHRERFDEALRDDKPQGRPVSKEERELRRALGVA